SRRKLRKDVLLIAVERKRLCPQHRVERECVVKMRKQVAAAGNLPSQRIAQRGDGHRDQHQICHSREMPRRGLAHLIGRGEMDEAVAQIDGRARVSESRVSAWLELPKV